MRPEHLAANAVLAEYPDVKAMKRVFDQYDRGIRSVVAPLVKRQRLMFREFRYFGWCDVRPE